MNFIDCSKKSKCKYLMTEMLLITQIARKSKNYSSKNIYSKQLFSIGYSFLIRRVTKRKKTSSQKIRCFFTISFQTAYILRR